LSLLDKVILSALLSLPIWHSHPSDLIVLGKKVRQDRQSGYVCLTDLSSLKGDGRFHIANWLRAVTTIRFIEEWSANSTPILM
jgi:hypothetical protein